MINRLKLHTLVHHTVAGLERWQKEHNLQEKFQNAVGPVQLVIGTDNLALHPTRVSVVDGIVLNKSNITGNYLLAGCSSKGDPNLQKEATVADGETKMMKKAPKSYQNKTEIIPSEDSLLKFLSQVEIPNPLKRCLKCKGCTDCRKSYLPDQQKNEAMNEVLKKSVSYNQKEKFFACAESIT